jgi:hypothetical protein
VSDSKHTRLFFGDARMSVAKNVGSVLVAALMQATAAAGTTEIETQPEPANRSLSTENEFYLVQNKYSAKCEIVPGPAEGGNLIAVGKAHKSQREATIAMKATSLCRTD